MQYRDGQINPSKIFRFFLIYIYFFIYYCVFIHFNLLYISSEWPWGAETLPSPYKREPTGPQLFQAIDSVPALERPNSFVRSDRHLAGLRRTFFMHIKFLDCIVNRSPARRPMYWCDGLFPRVLSVHVTFFFSCRNLVCFSLSLALCGWTRSDWGALFRLFLF